MAMVFQAVGHAIAKPIGALLLGGFILWRVALHAGPPTGRALVHVSTTPADVSVNDDVYHVESLYQTPVVCELKPGRHTARMMQGGRLLYHEDFRIVAGEDVVLAAWDQYDDGRSPGRGRLGDETSSAHRGASRSR
jgi:hypothetical protein